MQNLNHTKKACLAGRFTCRKAWQVLAIIILLIAYTSSFAQNRNAIDSLKTIVNNIKAEDTTIIHAYLDLSYVYKNIDLDTALSYADLALNKSVKINYKKGIADAYRRKGVTMTRLNKYTSADSLLNIAISIYSEINDQTGIMNCYIAFSAVACYKEENRLVVDYSLKALKIAEEKKLIKKKGLIFNNIGIVYKNMGDYENAIKYELDALRILKKFNNKRLTANCNINIGILFQEINEIDKALEYLNNALKLFIELKDINRQGICLLNIGIVYFVQKEYNKALENYNNAFVLFKKSNDLKGISISYLNIGIIYREQGKYDKANVFLNKALEIKEQLGDKKGLAECYLNIAKIETVQKNYKFAEEYCLKSIELCEQNNALNDQRKSLEQLATIYNLSGKYQKVYTILTDAATLKDSLFSYEKAKKIAHLEEKYLTEKQIQALEYENNIKTIKINHHKKTHKIYTIVLIFAIAAIIIILIQFRKKNIAYKFLVSKNLDVLSKEKELKILKRKITISNDKKEEILEKLEKILDNEKVFKDFDLTIDKLANNILTNSKYLSIVINEEFGKNYNDFINEYRVKEAMLLLSDFQKCSSLSMVGIANESGFRSVSIFNIAFKKFAGITPSKFRNKAIG